MPNVNSNGKFGTSMDYSQMLDIRRKYAAINYVNQVNPTNVTSIKPQVNMDNKTRGIHRVQDAFFNRGLVNIIPRIGVWR